MATKKEQFNQAMLLCEKHGLSEEVTADFRELLEPKKGGQAVDIESVVTRNEDGVITDVICKLSGVSLPATLDFFYEDKNSKIVNEAGEGLSRTSKQAKAIKREHDKTFKASKNAIMDDVLEGNIEAAEGKAQIEALSTEPDYSGVTAELPVEEPEAVEAE